MAKYTVKLMFEVPHFAEIVVEAEDQYDAEGVALDWASENAPDWTEGNATATDVCDIIPAPDDAEAVNVEKENPE